MYKRILVSFFFICVFFTHITSAQEIQVYCTNGDCDSTPVEHFFSTTEVWYPGKSVSRSIIIWNKSDSQQVIGLEAKNVVTIGKLDEVMHIVIDRTDGTRIWNGPLSLFYDSGEIVVHPELKKNEATRITVLLYMYMTAEDEYQNMNTQFDLDLGFIVPQTITPKPCLITDLPNAPTDVVVQKATSDSVRIGWQMVQAFTTGYTIMWGTDYAAENTGLLHVGRTNGASIQRLTEGVESYLFKVRANNGCLAGVFSEPSTISIPTPTPTPILSQSPTRVSTSVANQDSRLTEERQNTDDASNQQNSPRSKNNDIQGIIPSISPSGQVQGVQNGQKISIPNIVSKTAQCNKGIQGFIFSFFVLLLIAALIYHIVRYPKKLSTHIFIGFHVLFILIVLLKLFSGCLFSVGLLTETWKVVFPILLGAYVLFAVYYTQRK